MHPAEFGKLAARHILVEIAEACRKEADACTMDERLWPDARRLLRARPILRAYDAFTVDELVLNPASVQPLEATDAWLLHEYDAITVDLVVNPASVQSVEMVAAGCWLVRCSRSTSLPQLS